MSNIKVYTYPASNNWIKTRLGIFSSVDETISAIENIVEDFEIVSDDFKIIKSSSGIKVVGTESVKSDHLVESIAYVIIGRKYIKVA